MSDNKPVQEFLSWNDMGDRIFVVGPDGKQVTLRQACEAGWIDLTKAIKTHRKGGTVTIKVAAKPINNAESTVEVEMQASYSLSLPKASPRKSTVFLNKNALAVADDPNQPELPGISLK